jgi:uncharacterized protein YkwD
MKKNQYFHGLNFHGIGNTKVRQPELVTLKTLPMSVNLFDVNFYRSANSGLNGMNDAQALSHFQNSGLNNGLPFSPFVDLSFYRASNSDLAHFSNQQAYEHLSNVGVLEGRRFSPFFDLSFYRRNNADLASFNNEQLFDHLRNSGVSEGRQFSQFFDVNFYLADNPDLAQAFAGNRLSAFQHFQNNGLSEGRRFSVAFDVNYYRNAHSDLAAANLSNKQLLEHFEISGLNEGRVSAESFNVKHYLSNNSDLTAAGFNYSRAYDHFVSFGLQEGRNASSYMSSDYAGNTLNTARNVALDSKTVIYRESVGDTDTHDYYRISLGSQSANFKLVLNGLNANADIEVFSNNGQEIARSTVGGSATESLSFSNLLAGIYYLRVYQGVSGSNTNYNLTLSATPASTLSQPASTVSNSSFIQRIVDLTNTHRQQAGLQPLRLNLKLTNSAQTHSEDMALRDFFNHTGLNGSSVRDRTLQQGYESSYVGENIAAGYSTPETVVQAWMDSEGHRANILNPKYQEIGIGYYYLANDTGNVNYKHYWTQDFGAVV